MKGLKVFAPATIGNIGPGFDVLGMAVKGIGDTLTARKVSEPGVRIVSVTGQANITTNVQKNTAGIAAREVMDLIGAKGGMEIRLEKGIPAGSGLGSSAASAAAGAFAANALFNGRLSREDLILPATKAEEAVSGGFFADNTAPSLLGRATVTRSCVPLNVTRIGYIDEMKLVIVTPEISILTREARAILPKRVAMAGFVGNMANACLISAAFAANNYALFAQSLKDVVVEPVRAKLIKGFKEVKEVAMTAGADGMAISGSGPTVFAVTGCLRTARKIEDAMLRTFKRVGVNAKGFITSVDRRGTRRMS